jgi:hypothetical protein
MNHEPPFEFECGCCVTLFADAEGRAHVLARTTGCDVHSPELPPTLDDVDQ